MSDAVPTRAALDALAALLEYPGEGFAARALACGATLEASAPDLAAAVAPLRAAALAERPEALEETYTRTFDGNPERSLEVGWHLFGEQYDRGAYLVRMRGLLRRVGVPEGTELPDHLPSVLRLLARLEPGEAALLADESVARAIERIGKGFAADPGNPWAGVVRAAGEAVRALAARRPTEAAR